MKVLVCDDLKDRCEEVVQVIYAGQPDLSVTALTDTPLTKQFEMLFDNIKSFLTNSKGRKPLNRLKFDDFDLVIIDNNLTQLVDIKGTRLTAESVAGYIRVFTKVPYIVSLNKNPDVDFDLRYLIGDYDTRADLALNTEHLSNPALWTGRREQAKEGFLPWYWPTLNTVARRRTSQIAFIRKHLNDTVVAALNIPREALDFLSLHAIGALYSNAEWNQGHLSKGKPFTKVTLRDTFMASNRSLPAKDDERAKLNAAANRGDDNALEVISRVVAADIDYWFRRDLLGPEEALVDVPHLLMRMPFLLGVGVNNSRKWNATMEKRTAPFGVDKTIFRRHLKEREFRHDIWTPHPSFWWPKLKTDEALNALFFEPKKKEWLDLVFCEDRSEFIERSSKLKGKSPTEFTTDFEGTWGRRYVAKLKGVKYAPRSRFAI